MVSGHSCSARWWSICSLEAREILDEWVNDKLRLEAGLNDSDDDDIVQANVRSVKQACNLSFDDDDDGPLQYLREPKDLLTFQDPSVYYETHDETDLVRDILHGSSGKLSSEVKTRDRFSFRSSKQRSPYSRAVESHGTK